MPDRSPRVKLRLYFSFIVSLVLILTMVCGLGIAILLWLMGVMQPSPILFIVMLSVASLIIGSILSGFVGEGVIRPISRLSDASKQVAAGDFTVQLETDSDIEEIRTTFQNFNSMVTELGATETLRSDFVANVSHEFKTPITAIEGYATLLQDPTQTEEERNECVEKILFNTGRLSALVGNILLLSKIENQTISPVKNTFRLDEQLRQALVALEPRWEEKALEFDVEMPDVTVEGYESLLSLVWQNLLSNAIKFSPHGSTVTVTMICKGDQVKVEVADNGPGMTEEVRRHIFEKFYQGDTSHRSEGNGLGLALVQKIVEMSGGTVEAESTPGSGSLFRVVLPRGIREELPANMVLAE